MISNLYLKNNLTTKTYFQTMAFSLALYFAFPFIQITWTPLVFNGVGIRTCGKELLFQEYNKKAYIQNQKLLTFKSPVSENITYIFEICVIFVYYYNKTG